MATVFARALVVCLALGLGAGPALAQSKDPGGEPAKDAKKDAEWVKVKTRFVPVRDFPFRTPTETTASVGGALALPTAKPMPTSPGEYKLGVDTNGDGQPDAFAKGAHDWMTVNLSYPDGTTSPYTMYLTHSGKNWSYRRSCYRAGSFEGTQIVLIDDNHDGYYDAFGADGMIVGSGMYASYLSKVVSIKGKLYEMKVDRSGANLALRPWQGETGKLDLASGFKAAGQLMAAVVKTADTSFNAAGKEITLPVGTYTLSWGAVARGAAWVRIRASKTIVVEADKTAKLKWGAPFRIDFSTNRQGTEVSVEPNSVHVLGSADEEYHTFQPSAFTPEVRIRNAQNQQPISAGTMTLG